MDALALFAFLSFMVTKCVDTVRNAIDLKNTFPKVIWNLASFAFGFAFAFLFHLNVFSSFHVAASAGTALTGFVLGGGGSFGHELMDWLSANGSGGNPKIPGTTTP